MNIRHILFLIAFLALPATAAAERPNILFISIDDFRPQTKAYGHEIMQS